MSDTKALVERLREFGPWNLPQDWEDAQTISAAAAALESQAARIAELERDLAAALAYKEDAERWRFVRDADPDAGPYITEHLMNDWGNWYSTVYSGVEADAAIDAARKERG